MGHDDPERPKRSRFPGHEVDTVRVHIRWLYQLEERLLRCGLDYEARKARAARIASIRLFIAMNDE